MKILPQRTQKKICKFSEIEKREWILRICEVENSAKEIASFAKLENANEIVSFQIYKSRAKENLQVFRF